MKKTDIQPFPGIIARAIVVILFLSVLHNSFAQPLTFEPRGVGGGGALFFPTFNPTNDNEFYVACDMSQMFHTTNFGASYDQIPFTKLPASSNSTYEFTNNTNIAYSIFNDGNAGYPVKTTDGGNTWLPMPGYTNASNEQPYLVKANFSNPNQLFVTDYGNLWFSNDGGTTFSLAKSADNGGSGIILGGVFWDGSTIYVGTNDGIVYSNNGGASFSVLPVTGLGTDEVIWSFAAAKQGVTTRFTAITANINDVYSGVAPWEYYGFAKGVYTMTDVNGTWVSRSASFDFNNDFIMYVAMAWNDVNTIYVGGNDMGTGGPLVMKSADAGATWAKKFITTNNANIITGWEGQGGDKGWGWSENCFGIAVAPNNSNKVIFPTFSNVQVSSDGGNTWTQAYVSQNDDHPAGANTPPRQYYHSVGIENTTAWQIHWQDANTMLAGFSDIGLIRSQDAGESWGFDHSGIAVNSVYRIARTSNGYLFAGCSGIHDMYQSTRLADNPLDNADGNGKIVYSSNNGASWSTIHNFGHPVFWVEGDPNNADRMYASVIHYGGTAGSQLGGIYRTDNLSSLASSTWTKLPNPPRTQGHPATIKVLNDGKMVCTFSGRRNSAGAFTNSSGVFLYDPATNAWTDVSHAGMYYWTKDIVIDPTDPSQNSWYVCVFSGWGGAPNGLGGLYKTTNRGTSWTKLTGSQFDRVTSITFNPANTTQAFLTTEMQGLWFSTDMNSAAPTWSLVGSYNFRQPERVFFNPFNTNEVWVASFGNSLKKGFMTAVVPVEWLSFEGEQQQNTIALRWSTASEKNNARFVVEHSRDAQAFTAIGSVPGQNTAVPVHQYGFTDKHPLPGYNYYRIRQEDVDGQFSVSSMISVYYAQKKESDVVILPNPATTFFTIPVIAPGFIRSVTVTNTTGKVVYQYKGEFSGTVSCADWSSGVYWVEVVTEEGTTCIKLVKE